jgi:hypothetical protein
MVIPEEREADFERKVKSPLFSEHFQKDNWTLVYFNALREAFTKTKARTALEPLFGQKIAAPLRENCREANDDPRLMEFGGSEALRPPGESAENLDGEA